MADELEELYEVKPDDFTAVRTRLADAAKKRGDAAGAKRISGARKPTTAAWVVNRLVLTDSKVRERLTDLGQRLWEAHAAMDGERIRELTAQQRRLVDELTRTALGAAELTNPSGALRDDVTGTLQAAIADPDVASRLGRLTKAEQWSGFGDLGDTTMVFSTSRPAKKAPPKEAAKPATKTRDDDQRETARRQHEEARAALAAAERAKAQADDALSERQSDLAVARLRLDDARKRLHDAERGLSDVEDAYEKAKQASREAAAVVKEARARMKG